MTIFLAASIIGAATAIAVPSPLPPRDCVPGPFMVFFDSGSAELAPHAIALLNNVASHYAKCGDMDVLIAGHTDRDGSDQANLLLSQRIANNVRTYLASKGIPVRVITVEAHGESRPLVQTDDGVREPQNRRAEISFGYIDQ